MALNGLTRLITSAEEAVNTVRVHAIKCTTRMIVVQVWSPSPLGRTVSDCIFRPFILSLL
jgi:hypothetical protein